MSMKVDIETVDAVRRRLAVEVPADAVTAEIDKAYAELGRGARVPGFRPGRAPRRVLERMFGDQIRADVFGRLIQRSYADALAQEHLDPVSQPSIVTEQAEPGAALRYSATVEIKPEVVLERYVGLEVQRPRVSVTDRDVDAYLERLRQGFAQLHPISDRVNVALGDVATIDYEARMDGKVVGRAENRTVEIGANGFPREFDQALVGAVVGSEPEFCVAYPADSANAELAGKSVDFRVRVRGLSRKEVPPVDDEFAKDHGECATLEELRQRVQKGLEADAARFADEGARRSVLAALAAANDVPIPPAMVETGLQSMMREVWQEWRERRIVPKNESEALARLRSDLEPRAREQVKVGLLLEAVARQEEIRVSEEDIDELVATMVTDAGESGDRVRALSQSPEARRELRARLLQSRVVDVLLARAAITDVDAQSRVAEAGEHS